MRGPISEKKKNHPKHLFDILSPSEFFFQKRVNVNVKIKICRHQNSVEKKSIIKKHVFINTLQKQEHEVVWGDGRFDRRE